MRILLRLAAGLLCGLTAAPGFAGDDVPVSKPGDSPVVQSEELAPTYDPPRVVPRPGLRSPAEWREIIDATWGPEPDVWGAVTTFDRFWTAIDEKFACFQDLGVDWRALWNRYRPEFVPGVSRGRVTAILNHLALALQESHTHLYDTEVNLRTALRPGVPLMSVGGWGENSHFGACLTPLPDRSLLVYKVADNHPLHLMPGDVILGYEGVPWKDLYPLLLQAELPITGSWVGSSPSAREHSFLAGLGRNWHLFDTIDVLRYSSGQVERLPTSLLDGQPRTIRCTEQMDLPGVPQPPGYTGMASWGILQGTQIGYIYVYGWVYNAEQEFYDAVRALTVDRDTVGLVIDFRYNVGGNMFLSDKGLNLLFRDRTPTIGFRMRGSVVDHLYMVPDPSGPPYNYIINNLPDEYDYDRPIAVLTGPGAVSSGDQVALRMTFHPRARTFGKSTAGAFNAPTALRGLDRRWQASYARADAYLLSDPGHYLTRSELPVNYPVWLDREDVARGNDTVVDLAARWISNRPPTASLAAPPTTECAAPDGAVVRLDGSSSTDPDSAPGTHDGIALFEWFENLGTSPEAALGTGEILEVKLPLGSHRISLRVRDLFGEQDVAGTVVAIVDTTPPSLSLSASPAILWPPNHRMAAVQASAAASDACGPASVLLESILSSEPDDSGGLGGAGGGDIQGAGFGTPDFLFSLRAARSGSGTGRTYTITYGATDSSGNTARSTATVSVPHDRGAVAPGSLRPRRGKPAVPLWDPARPSNPAP